MCATATISVIVPTTIDEIIAVWDIGILVYIMLPRYASHAVSAMRTERGAVHTHTARYTLPWHTPVRN